MTHSGLLGWGNSVRLTMASDPGRQGFKDQIQALGFLFLDDYLDSILSGAKQDPLIELVKTPGRKKAVAAKVKQGPSKLSKSTILEDGENITPVDSFQKALWSVKTDTDRGRSPIKSDEKVDIKAETQRMALRPIQPHFHNQGLTSTSLQPSPLLMSSLEPPAVLTEHNELSVIAEDEEPSERTQPSTPGCGTGVPELFPHPPVEDATPLHQESKASISDMDTDTFHSIPLTFDNEVSRNSGPSMQITSSSMVVDSDGGLPEHRVSSDRREHPTDHPREDNTTTFSKAPDKPLSSLFPALPEPMPLRKSTRLRDSSMNSIMLGAATPGATAGKRTSWLAKAREVKALEGTGKKLNTQVIPSQPMLNHVVLSQGTKRKSEDMLVGNLLVNQEERVPKVAKVVEGGSASRRSFSSTTSNNQGTSSNELQRHETHNSNISEEGVLDILKKTVQGLGVRAGKTMGKSLGGEAATALAEAKAAAEARLAERDRREETSLPVVQTPPVNPAVRPEQVDVPVHLSIHENRISLSDLFPRDGRVKEKHRAPEKVFHKATPPPPAVIVRNSEAIRLSTSTTPPNSPPRPADAVAPVFTKLAPVFVPPTQVASKLSPIPTESFGSVFPLHNVPSSMAVGFGIKLPSPTGRPLPAPLTAQSTIESIHSGTIFDQDDTPPWLPSTQDTEYTTVFESQSQPQAQICDEDDSWPVDEKISAGVHWTYGASKEDSMTWSTLPSQSQRADTGPVIAPIAEEGIDRYATNGGGVEVDIDEDLIPCDEELEEIVLGSKSTVNLVKPELTRSRSQLSMAASESSQSHTGFFGQASKFLSSALGASKKKPEVKKVLQMAAVAAKKQQEEADKKAVRLKEMDMRRQQAILRKAEEEKAKSMEEERKMKEDAERRRRDKEEQTNKQPFKPTTSKRDDDTKKRKVDPSPMDKKTELKKPAPSVLLGKSHLKHALKQPVPSSVTHINATQATTSSFAPVDPFKQAAIASTPLQKKKPQATHEDFTQPSQMVQSQMAARAKAKLEASKPTIPSESIELPDINSEYSDSEDEDRPRTYDPPDWAQSPELRQALEQQSTINPDDIFGAVRPLKMEEIFKTKTSRFRARTSSANWTGSDRLTVQEELEYARRMGFK